MTRTWRWRSGGCLALVTSLSALLSFLALRAASDAALAPWTLAAGAAVLGLVLWPLAARATRLLTLTAVLAVGQLGAHALGVVLAGQVSGPRALVCCPSAQQVRPGLLGSLTAQAGVALVVVQLLACLALAVVHRSTRQVADDTVVAVAALLARPLTLLLTVLVPVVRDVEAVPEVDLPELRGRVVAAVHGLRAPPRRPAPVPLLVLPRGPVL